MKKTFPLTDPAHKPVRVIESIKKDIRKYLKRERRKALPDGVDFWDFDCRVGDSAENAEIVHVEQVINRIDRAASKEWNEVYVEILAAPGHRVAKEKSTDEEELPPV